MTTNSWSDPTIWCFSPVDHDLGFAESPEFKNETRPRLLSRPGTLSIQAKLEGVGFCYQNTASFGWAGTKAKSAGSSKCHEFDKYNPNFKSIPK